MAAPNIGDLAAAAVAADDDLRDSLKGLVSDVIQHMRYTMRHGDPAAKLQLSRAITPQLLSAINKVDEEQGRAAEREAYKRLMGAFKGELDPDREYDDE
jgi:hypothetical protein